MKKLVRMVVAVIMSFTLVGCGDIAIDVNQYTIEYVDYDGTVLQTQDYDFEADLSSVTAPTNPERSGYTFDSWSGTLPATMGEETVTLTATYTINQYAFEYVDYDGTVLQTADYDFGSDLSGVTAPTSPERVGYTFDSWSGTLPATMGTTQVTITATYTMNQYTITYNLDGGRNNMFNVRTYNIEDNTITLLAATKEEATFSGWYDNLNFKGLVVTEIPSGSYEDIVLYAKWEMNEYAVEYVDHDGTVLQTESYDFGTIIGRVTAPVDPERVGYTFDSWSGTVPVTMGSTNVTLTATYTINQYTISYDLDGGSNNVGNVSVYNIEDNTITLLAATKAEVAFSGWYDTSDFSGEVVTEISSGSYGDITLYARWESNQYAVEYVDYDKTVLQTKYYDSGAVIGRVTAPVNPERTGYTFDSWSGTVPITMGTTNVTITATYTVNQYTISYNLNGGSNNVGNIAGYNIEDNTFTLLAATKAEATFIGWYDNSDFSGEVVTEILGGSYGDLTLYARWEINEYQINYILVDSSYNPSNEFNLAVGETITNVSLGFYHSAALTSEGRIFTWGYNDNGQLGNGTTIDKFTPTEITNQFNLAIGETITSVSLGGNHSSVVTSEGRIFTWGYNVYGQLGDGTLDNKLYPTEITNQFNLAIGELITNVSLGAYHSSAFTSEGRIFTWGHNNHRELGDGTTVDKYIPTDITSQFNLTIGETITSVSMGGNHSSVVTSEGRIFTWGRNDFGQLGDGTTTSKDVPTEITNKFNLAIGESITNVSLGAYHSSAITSEGRIFTWGLNNDGRLGNGTTVDKQVPTEITNQFNLAIGETITSVSLGSDHSAAVTSEGRIFTWGRNYYGRLGDGTTVDKHVPTLITNQFNLAVGETITSISLGSAHSAAVTSEGRIFTWGLNSSGQLGDGTYTSKYIPTEITYHFYYIFAYEEVLYEFGTAIIGHIISYEGYTIEGWYTDSDLSHPYNGYLMPNYPLYALYIED